MIIHQVVREGYGTFQGDNGFHKSRIFSIIVISILFSVFGKEIQKSLFPAVLSSISILAGFCFTALFSPIYFYHLELPKPKSENSRYNLDRLSRMSKNFRKRCKLFLFAATANIAIMIFLSLDYEVNFDSKWIIYIFFNDEIKFIGKILSEFLIIVKLFSVFITFESLYIFFRISETVMEIIDTRRIYLEGYSDK